MDSRLIAGTRNFGSPIGIPIIPTMLIAAKVDAMNVFEVNLISINGIINKCYGEILSFPILKTLHPHTEQVPFIAGLPFFIVVS